MDRQRLIRNVLIAGIGVAGVALSLGYARHLMGSDPFARFDKRQAGPQDVLASMKDVDMVQYHKDQLISQAHVGQLNMRTDRQTFDLTNVYDGVLYTEDGKIDFRAEQATWDAANLQLNVNAGASLASPNFSLRMPSFTVDQRNGMVKVPKEIRGRFFGGEITAKEFAYNLNTGDGKVGPNTWVGKASLQQDTGTPQTPTKWNFQSSGLSFYKNGIQVWKNAQASDGEVVVQGDQIERNTKTDVITATGNCLYFSQKANLACDRVVVYRKEKRAVLSGSVRMLIKPKDSMERQVTVGSGEIPPFRPMVPDQAVAEGAPSQSSEDRALDDEIRSGKTTRKYPVVVLSSNVEYWYGKGNRHAVITGSPQASQQLTGPRWRKVWANKVLYDGEKESLRLLSAEGKEDVRMKTSKGEDILADWFEFSTKEGDDSWQGYHMRGDVMADDEPDSPMEEEKNPPAAAKEEKKPPQAKPVEKKEVKPPTPTTTGGSTGTTTGAGATETAQTSTSAP